MTEKFLDLTIGAFARAAEVSVETVRFYQRRGLLTEPEKPSGRIRRYGSSDVARVRFIKASQRLGFSLDEVAGLLSLDDGAHCDAARALAEAKLLDVRGKLADLRRIEKALAALVRECCATTGTVSCPLISSLQSLEDPSVSSVTRAVATAAGPATCASRPRWR